MPHMRCPDCGAAVLCDGAGILFHRESDCRAIRERKEAREQDERMAVALSFLSELSSKELLNFAAEHLADKFKAHPDFYRAMRGER